MRSLVVFIWFSLFISIPVNAEMITVQDSWVGACNTQNNQMRCQISQKIEVQNQNKMTNDLHAVVRVTQTKQKVLDLILPLGVDLSAGITIQIDEQPKIGAQYLTCFEGGCAVLIPIDETLFESLKSGQITRVSFQLLNMNKPVVVSLSLDNFASVSAILQ